jgi:dTDP-4-amino-4,6-dideoxygalactose transaminase
VPESRILLSPPDIGRAEEIQVLKALQSGWVAPGGPIVAEFEDKIATVAGRAHAVALSSGTAAIHLGLRALGVGMGDVVVCTSLTFIASANPITYLGATPVFIDVSASDGNLSPSLLKMALEDLKSKRVRVAAVVVVDFLGAVADYVALNNVCQSYSIPMLADAAESVGSVRFGRPAGSFGEGAVFSFNGNKIATSSGGGAFLTDDAELARTVRHLSNQAREDTRHYEHRTVGYNYRMSSVLAAIGIAQFARLPEFLEKRRGVRSFYRGIFGSSKGVRVLGRDDAEENCWLTSVLVMPEEAGFSSADLANFLESRNIESRPLWKPMHMQPIYSCFPSYLDGTSERFFHAGLALPSGSVLGPAEMGRIASALEEFLSRHF